MADSTDLKLRIVPELDESAKRKVQDELDKFKSTVPVVPSGGGTGKGGGSNAPRIKEENIEYNKQGQIIGKLTAEHKEVVRAIETQRKAQDLLLRSTRTAAEGEIQALQQKASVGQITMDQMNQGIIVQQQLIETAEASAREEFGYTVAALGHLGQAYQDLQPQIGNAQKGVFHSIDRLNTGFNTMAGSMTKVVSQTKATNLAFMNMGRIVQDAPFGLIGIANNIDPMVVTFANLANEIDITTGKMRGFGGALAQMGKSLLGPAGLIFILGSAIPSALLVLQSHQRKAAKESVVLADAFKKVADEFAKLSSQAAGEKGLRQVTRELDIVNQNITLVNSEFAKTEEQIQSLVIAQTEFALSTGQVAKTEGQIREAFREQNKELFFKLDNTKKTLDAQKEQLETEKSSIESTQFISDLRKQRNIAESLSIKEQIELRKKLTDLEIRTIELTNAAQAEVLRNVEKLKEEIRSIANDPELWGTPQGMNAIRALRTEITNVQSGVARSAQSTISFIDRTLEKQAMLRIGAQNSLQLSQDENLSWEQRQRYLENGLSQQREIVTLQQQAVSDQLKIATEEQEQINLRVKQIELANELNLIDEKALEFAQQRADAEFQVWMNRQQQILALEEEIEVGKAAIMEASLSELDFGEDLAQARFASATEWIDRQAQYEIDKALYVGDRIKALSLEKDLFIAQQRSMYIDQEYDAETANAMAIADANKEFAIAEVQLRKEVNQELYAAIGEFAGQALTAIFGDNKRVAIAQVVIDTLMGVQKIWSQAGLNPVVGALASAALVAKGVTTIRKINKTEVGGSNISADNQNPTFVTSQDSYEVGNSRITRRTPPLISQNMANSTASMLSNPMMNNSDRISVTANVDRRGLAIAVREGERSIRTQQFDFR